MAKLIIKNDLMIIEDILDSAGNFHFIRIPKELNDRKLKISFVCILHINFGLSRYINSDSEFIFGEKSFQKEFLPILKETCYFNFDIKSTIDKINLTVGKTIKNVLFKYKLVADMQFTCVEDAVMFKLLFSDHVKIL